MISGGRGRGVFVIELQFESVGMKILGVEMHKTFCISERVCGLPIYAGHDPKATRFYEINPQGRK